MRQIRALSVASFRELLRDPMTTGLGMVFPMSFIAMFLLLPDLPQPEGRISALAFGLPAILIFAALSLGLTGTAAPIAQLRKDGVLRSLGMTPVTRSQYLLAQIPARVLVIGVEFCLIWLIAVISGSLKLTEPAMLLWAMVLCVASTLPLGLLIGSRSDNPGLVGALAGILPAGLLFLCGLFLPYRMMPAVVEYVGLAFPYTYVGDMLRHSLVGAQLQYSVLQGSAVCIVWTAAMGFLAWRWFRWDSQE